MQHISLEPYVERVYGYALHRTFSREEADELAQEILLTVLQELPRLRDETRFEPFLWGVASRVTLRFRRTMGRLRRHMSWDDLSAFPAPEDASPQEYAKIRRQVAMLSAQWRDMLVLHYFDGLSTREIANRLSLPEGTVTWRLSRARQRLKEEYETMNETALRPQTLWLGYSGSDAAANPCEYINDALSQNLLILCRETPQTVEALAAHTGVPAYYIEDKLAELLRREAMSESAKGKFRTEIPIYTKEYADYAAARRALFVPLAEEFAAALQQLADGAAKLGHYAAERSTNDLLWLYGMMAMVHLETRWNPTTPPPHPLRFDGGRWTYHGYVAQPGLKYHYSLNCLCSRNLGSRGTYSHTVFRFGGYAERDMMMDTQINLCEDVLCGRAVDDPVTAAKTIEGGYLRREKDGTLTVTPAAMTLAQHEAFCHLAEEAFAPVMPKYQAALKRFSAGLMQLFPPHLADAGKRLSAYVFRSAFADPIREAIVSSGLLPAPTPGTFCDVLVQFK